MSRLVEVGPVPHEVVDAVGGAAAGGRHGLERLLDALAAVDDAGDLATALATLRLLAGHPRLLSRLDEHVRAVPWYLPHQSPVIGRLAAALTRHHVGPVALAVASSHSDGRIRERAVTAILSRPWPALTPFLVLRSADWVRQVRDPARAGLALLLTDDPAGHLPVTLPTARLLSARSRGDFVTHQVTAALLAAPASLRATWARSAPAAQRRFLFDLDLAYGRFRLDDMVAVIADPDVRVRARAAEAACREAVWTSRTPVLHRLTRSRHAEVRAVALTGLLRLGRHTEVTAFLDDRHQLVRAIAREAARRDGVDAAAAYRAFVAGDTPNPGAVAGLVESGYPADAPLLHPLLAHPDARLRAAAVRGLGQLNAVDVPLVVPLLRDPVPAVVREAATALRPIGGVLPPALPWDLLADPLVERRRAGYRLLGTRPPAVRLRAGLLLALDADPRLAERARADVTGLCRTSLRTSWRTPAAAELDLTAEQRRELLRLAARAAPALGPETTELLTSWLERS